MSEGLLDGPKEKKEGKKTYKLIRNVNNTRIIFTYLCSSTVHTAVHYTEFKCH